MSTTNNDNEGCGWEPRSSPVSDDKDAVNNGETSQVSEGGMASVGLSLAEVCSELDNQDTKEDTHCASNSASSSPQDSGASKKPVKSSSTVLNSFLSWLLTKYAQSGCYVFDAEVAYPRLTTDNHLQIKVPPNRPDLITCPCVARKLAGYVEADPDCYFKHPAKFWELIDYVTEFSFETYQQDEAWYQNATRHQNHCNSGFKYNYSAADHQFSWCVKNKRVDKWHSLTVPDSVSKYFESLFSQSKDAVLTKDVEAKARKNISEQIVGVIKSKLPDIFIRGWSREQISRKAKILCQTEPGWLDCTPKEIRNAITFMQAHKTTPIQYILEMLKDELDGRVRLDHQPIRNYLKSFVKVPSAFLLSQPLRYEYDRICKADVADENPDHLLAMTAPPTKQVAKHVDKCYDDTQACADLFGVDDGKENVPDNSAKKKKKNSPKRVITEEPSEGLADDSSSSGAISRTSEETAAYWGSKLHPSEDSSYEASDSSDAESSSSPENSEIEDKHVVVLSDHDNSESDSDPDEKIYTGIPVSQTNIDGLPKLPSAHADAFDTFIVWLNSDFIKCHHDDAIYRLRVHSEIDNDVERPKITQPNASRETGKSAAGVYFELFEIYRPSLFRRWWHSAITLGEIFRGIDRNYEQYLPAGECHLSWQMFHNVSNTIRGSPHDPAQIARQLQGADFGCGLPDNFGSEHLSHVVMACFTDGPSSSYTVREGVSLLQAWLIFGTLCLFSFLSFGLFIWGPKLLSFVLTIPVRRYHSKILSHNPVFRYLTCMHEYFKSLDSIKITTPKLIIRNWYLKSIIPQGFINFAQRCISFYVSIIRWMYGFPRRMHLRLWRLPLASRVYDAWYRHYQLTQYEPGPLFKFMCCFILLLLFIVINVSLIKLFFYLRNRRRCVDEPDSPFCFRTQNTQYRNCLDRFNDWLRGEGGSVTQDLVAHEFKDYTDGRNKLVITDPVGLARRMSAAFFRYWTGVIPSGVHVYNKFNPAQLLNGFLKRFCAERPEMTDEKKRQVKHIVQTHMIANMNCFVRTDFYRTHTIWDFINHQVSKGSWSWADIEGLQEELFQVHCWMESKNSAAILHLFKKRFKLSSFVKDEIYFKETAPRFIVSPNWLTRILFGYLYWPIEAAIEESNWGKKHLIKHMSNEERIECLNKDFAGCTEYVQSDGAAFECSVSKWDLENIEMPTYLHVLQEVDSFYVDLFKDLFWYIHQPHWLVNKHYKIWVDRIIRWSGLSNTSMGNGECNYAKTVATYIYEIGVEPDVVKCEGDDCLAGFKKKVSQLLHDVNAFGIALSFDVANKWYDLEFCGFKLDAQGHVTRDPFQLKAKLFSLFMPQPCSLRLQHIRYKAKLLAYQELYPHVTALWDDPEVKDFINELKYISRETAAKYLASHPGERPWLMNLNMKRTENVEEMIRRL